MYTGNCTWSTCQDLLGWVIDTFNMTLLLTPHQVSHFREIISAITCTRNRIDVDKWHWVLGELRSTEITLPRD